MPVMMTAVSRDAFLTTVWVGGLSLPVMVLAFRIGLGYGGWVTAFYMFTYGPLLLLLGIVIAALSHTIPKKLPPTRRLWWPILAFSLWYAFNILGAGIVVSDLTDQADINSPLGSLIPQKYELRVAGICVLFAFVSAVSMFVPLERVRIEFRDSKEGQAREGSSAAE